MADDHCIERDVIRRGGRPHVYFYECDANGHGLGGRSVIGGSAVAIAFASRRRNDDGIVSYLAYNDVILTEGANGAIGPKTSRYILRVRRPHR